MLPKILLARVTSIAKRKQALFNQAGVTHQFGVRNMKLTAAVAVAPFLWTAWAVSDDASSLLSLRALQQNNNGYNYNNNDRDGDAQHNGQGVYDDMQSYLQAQIASRTFSFTGCFLAADNSGMMESYSTYRLCQTCNYGGCIDNSNGDYVTTMEEFTDAYREYNKEGTGGDITFFECMR